MNIDWQVMLYPIGFIASIAFGLRFLLQWLQSEYQGKSLVTRHFWIISLIGNIALLVHSIIQQQFHIALVQTCNTIISWRNLNLLKSKEKQCRFGAVIGLLIFSCLMTTGIFIVQDLFCFQNFSWFRVPILPWGTQKSDAIPFYVHMIGSFGILLFASRFWVQWWLAEWYRTSFLGTTFWVLSLAGNIISLYYFIYIFDPANFLGPIFGAIPCIRNLMLINKSKKVTV